MSEVIPLQTPSEMRARIAQLSAELEQHQLKNGGGGGGGTSGGMTEDWKQSVEDRLGELRSDIREVKSDLTVLKVDVATIKENMRHLPTKPWIFTTLAAMVTVIITLMTFITGMLIRFLPHAS